MFVSSFSFRAGVAGQWAISIQEGPNGNLCVEFGARVWPIVAAVEQQQSVLRQIEAMDERCRRGKVSRETARQALPRLEIPWCYERENGWDFLRGSSEPEAMTAEEARRLLADEPSPKRGD